MAFNCVEDGFFSAKLSCLIYFSTKKSYSNQPVYEIMPPDAYRRRREIDVQTRAILITLARLSQYPKLERIINVLNYIVKRRMLHLQRIPPRLSVLILQCDSPRRHVFLAVLVDRPFLAILAPVHIAPLGKQGHPVENSLLPTTPVQDHSLIKI